MKCSRATVPDSTKVRFGSRLHRSWPLILLLFLLEISNAQRLKSVVYDFDGFDLGATSLPEGDYSYGDLTYEIVANPYPASGQVGDRALRLNVAWNAGYAAFGRGIRRFLELSGQSDRFNFFVANPTANGHTLEIEVVIAEDDDNSGNYDQAHDDSWRTTISIAPMNGWQLCSVPLSALTDHTSGGDGQFNAGFTGGQLLLVELRPQQPTGATGSDTYYIDMLCFSEGPLPHGATISDLPAKAQNDHCLLGAHMKEKPGEYHKIPQSFHALLPAWPNREIRYVNSYMQWATDGGTTPHVLPGQGYQMLLDAGFTPVITWEPMFAGFSAADPAQPSLDEISGGNYDAYLDAFAGKLKNYDDTIIVRLMHEFDGDWYPWCTANNGHDPQKFIQAFRHVVNRVKLKGATKVKWMWCPNSDFTPQASWNWVVSAYPGDSYVDIVATDVYNAHYPTALPWWRSFRWQTAEIYYYLTKYFPTKPFFICENACRERRSTEPSTSQDKAGWIKDMDRELQSYFSLTRALIFFSEERTEDWSVNSSTTALNSLRDHIWADDYYFLNTPVNVRAAENPAQFALSPNPAQDLIQVSAENAGPVQLEVVDRTGRCVFRQACLPGTKLDVSALPRGLYICRIQAGAATSTRKIILE